MAGSVEEETQLPKGLESWNKEKEAVKQEETSEDQTADKPKKA